MSLLRRARGGSCSRSGGMIGWYGRQPVGYKSAAVGWHPAGRAVGRNIALRAIGLAGRAGAGGGR